MENLVQIQDKQTQMKKLKEYAKKVERTKPLVDSKEPEGKINRTLEKQGD